MLTRKNFKVLSLTLILFVMLISFLYMLIDQKVYCLLPNNIYYSSLCIWLHDLSMNLLNK